MRSGCSHKSIDAVVLLYDLLPVLVISIKGFVWVSEYDRVINWGGGGVAKHSVYVYMISDTLNAQYGVSRGLLSAQPEHL